MDPVTRKNSFIDLLYAPFGCLLQLPGWMAVFLSVLIIGGGIWAYYTLNTDYWGLTSPPFDKIAIQGDHDRITLDTGRYWLVTYERPGDSTFQGLVRHVNPDHESTFPMMTHDILVTSGDYSDMNKVHTSVQFHMFYYSWDANPPTKGAINLLHTVPDSEPIYKLLLRIRTGMFVKIRGREILRATFYDQGNPNPQGWWQDHGCNTLLVRSVEFLNQ
jgi:hypothetical protein